jgi:CubicO group peptidase (beta-lactamase class C family)
MKGESLGSRRSSLWRTPFEIEQYLRARCEEVAHDNRATIHAKVGDSFQALYERNPDAQSPAGGISSNVNDLAKWMQLILARATGPGVGTSGGPRRLRYVDRRGPTRPCGH